LRSLLRSRQTAPHPCHPTRCEPALVKETGPPPRATPTRSRLASRLPSSERTRCFSPTSATDSQSEHSRIARLPSAQLALRRPPPAASIAAEAALTSAVDGARPPFDDPTPAGRALDGAQLSFGRFAHGASLLVEVKSRASARRRCLSTAVFSTACGADDRPLALPVAPRSTWKPRLLRGARAAATAIASTTSAFPAQSTFHRQSVSCRIAFACSCFFGDPPPISRLCRRRFGFRRSFATSSLSREEARPDVVIHELFTRGREGPNAACRLLQPMRPASTTAVRPNPTRPRFWSPRRAACLRRLPFGCLRLRGWRCTFRCTASRESRARGLPRHDASSFGTSPTRSLARGASPQPDRLGHLLSHARDGHWLEIARVAKGVSLCRDPFFTNLPGASSLSRARLPWACVSEAHGGIGPLHAFPREGERDRLHPRCLPSPHEPVPGLGLAFHNLSPACGE
jgi:hypothetical protein